MEIQGIHRILEILKKFAKFLKILSFGAPPTYPYLWSELQNENFSKFYKIFENSPIWRFHRKVGVGCGKLRNCDS